jgi:peptidoglycan/xylan/chitin deacetylase (PgdA/CDA1 family)
MAEGALPRDIASRARRRPRPSPSGKPAAAITFDDGHEDNHSYALPILAKHGVSATFFITAGFVDRDPSVLQRFQQLLGCGTDNIVPLDWAQVRELRANGMDIGSHTYSHPNLARLSRAKAEEELRTSKDLISDRLGAAIDLFAYPFGKPRVHVTSITTEVARATGYRVAAAVTFRGVLESDPVFMIPGSSPTATALPSSRLRSKAHTSWSDGGRNTLHCR